MRRIVGAIGGTVLGSLVLVATVAAASPTPSPSPSTSVAVAPAPGAVAAVLGLTIAEVRELRQEGQSLAQIAAQRGVPAQKVIDALVAQWRERIEVRVENGVLSEAQAAQLTAQLGERAQAMVSSTAPGGMRGAAVGAGPANGSGNGIRARDGSGTGAGLGPRGSGTGTCDGTGPYGAGRS